MTAPLFTRDSLAALRDVNRASLVSRATIDAPTITGGGAGGANTGARSWAPIAGGVDVPCRLAPIVAGTPGATADQTISSGHTVLVLDLEAPALIAGYRVTVTGTDLFTGQSWTRAVIVRGPHGARTFRALAAYECEDAAPGQR